MARRRAFAPFATTPPVNVQFVDPLFASLCPRRLGGISFEKCTPGETSARIMVGGYVRYKRRDESLEFLYSRLNLPTHLSRLHTRTNMSATTATSTLFNELHGAPVGTQVGVLNLIGQEQYDSLDKKDLISYIVPDPSVQSGGPGFKYSSQTQSTKGIPRKLINAFNEKQVGILVETTKLVSERDLGPVKKITWGDNCHDTDDAITEPMDYMLDSMNVTESAGLCVGLFPAKARAALTQRAVASLEGWKAPVYIGAEEVSVYSGDNKLRRRIHAPSPGPYEFESGFDDSDSPPPLLDRSEMKSLLVGEDQVVLEVHSGHEGFNDFLQSLDEEDWKKIKHVYIQAGVHVEDTRLMPDMDASNALFHEPAIKKSYEILQNRGIPTTTVRKESAYQISEHYDVPYFDELSKTGHDYGTYINHLVNAVKKKYYEDSRTIHQRGTGFLCFKDFIDFQTSVPGPKGTRNDPEHAAEWALYNSIMSRYEANQDDTPGYDEDLASWGAEGKTIKEYFKKPLYDALVHVISANDSFEGAGWDVLDQEGWDIASDGSGLHKRIGLAGVKDVRDAHGGLQAEKVADIIDTLLTGGLLVSNTITELNKLSDDEIAESVLSGIDTSFDGNGARIATCETDWGITLRLEENGRGEGKWLFSANPTAIAV